MSAPHSVIDAYAHVGLPRFVTLAHYRQIMEFRRHRAGCPLLIRQLTGFVRYPRRHP